MGMIAITIAGIFVKNPATGLAYTQLPENIFSFQNPITALAPTFGKLSFSGLFAGSLADIIGVCFILFSFFLVDLFGSVGVLLGLAGSADMVDENGNVPGAGKALFVSARRRGAWCHSWNKYCHNFRIQQRYWDRRGRSEWIGCVVHRTALYPDFVLFTCFLNDTNDRHSTSACDGGNLYDRTTVPSGSWGFKGSFACFYDRRNDAFYLQYCLQNSLWAPHIYARKCSK